MVKAYLKGTEGILFPLRNVTTVGRGNCDFVVKVPGVDYEHCRLSYSEQDGCYVLQDLNSTQGTYVNDVRIQNAAVRLAPGDLIRFGYGGQVFELVQQNELQITIPPVCQKLTIGKQTPTIIHEGELYQSFSSSGVQSLPHIPTITSSAQAWYPHSTSQPTPPVPRPPLKTRPLSAGAAQRNMQKQQAVPAVIEGWLKPAPEQKSDRTSSITDLQDKDLKIMQMNDEITKLRNIELDSFKKDTVIQQLQEAIMELKSKSQQEPSYILGGNTDVSVKLLHLETEISLKKEEIAYLRKQLQDDKEHSPAILRQELAERIKEISQLKSELEQVKKDKGITAGLVTQMQKDFASKDYTVSRLTREVEVLKKEVREKDAQLVGQQNPRDLAKLNEDNVAKEKELTNLKQKMKAGEQKLQEQQDSLVSLRGELDKSKSELASQLDLHKKTLADLTQLRAQLEDVRRSERVVRVDLEQSRMKYERLRSIVVQLTFSTAAIKGPDKEITDDELVAALKEVVKERDRLLSSIKDLEFNVIAAKAEKADLLAEANQLKEALEKGENWLKENGRLSRSLKEQSTRVDSLTENQDLKWIASFYARVLMAEQEWEHSIELALENSGINLTNSNDNPGQHIQVLFSKLELSSKEVERLQNQMRSLEEEHKANLELQLSALRKEMEDRIQDEVEKTKLQGERDLNVAIDEIRATEQKKRDIEIEAERRKMDQLTSMLADMRKSSEELQQQNQAKLEEAAQAVKDAETLRAAEGVLKEQIEKLEQQLKDQATQFSSEKEELLKKFQVDHVSYEEQVKQHSLTICSMEASLSKLATEKKSLQDQLSKLKSKPAIPPKVVVQRSRDEAVALEHIANALRQENTLLKREIMELQAVVVGLRRDLTGAAVHISDITGEISESQKQEIERNRELLFQKDGELTDLRQQLAKLSNIIDSQKAEIQKMEAELSKEKTMCRKYKLQLEENTGRVEKLEMDLEQEKTEQKKQLELLENKGLISSELTALGAQCRGERHDQVIARQREALAELRSKIKILEQSKPLPYTEDQALHKIMHLQRELAELRKDQSMADNVFIQESALQDKGGTRMRALMAPPSAELEIEQSAHRETMAALECSEATYLSLCRCLSEALNIMDLEGLSTLAHVPKDERERLMAVRKKLCQLLSSRIEALKERLARRDRLVEDYESQIAQLKANMVLSERKAQELEDMKSNIRSRSEESAYLRESVNRMRDQLNQEKRLNSLARDKKMRLKENASSFSDFSSRSHHHCPVEDPRHVVKKKEQQELLKRKNYEIKKLKKELSLTERDLHETLRAQQVPSDLLVQA